MGFVFGVVLGIIVGLAIIVAFVRSENSRSTKRSQLAATIAAFARMTVEDSRKLLPSQYYPSWVVFSSRQKFSLLLFSLLSQLFFFFNFHSLTHSLLFLSSIFQLTWLNSHLTKIWPYVNDVIFSSLLFSSLLAFFLFLFIIYYLFFVRLLLSSLRHQWNRSLKNIDPWFWLLSNFPSLPLVLSHRSLQVCFFNLFIPDLFLQKWEFL